jgi:hypothetical protein
MNKSFASDTFNILPNNSNTININGVPNSAKTKHKTNKMKF